ncbi:MAG TPA: hypothetical protein VHV78_01545 [Gemmatimonadaceae bacterium]|nr:hypothetical protein [Gemmatimonadaceae bacterium]
MRILVGRRRDFRSSSSATPPSKYDRDVRPFAVPQVDVGNPGAVVAVSLTVCATLVCEHVPALAYVGARLAS